MSLQIKQRTYFNLRSGAPPPTHQSTMARNAFRLSSRPFLDAIVFKLSSARVLCIGLDCAMRVNAERRSESVPEARTLDTNCSSDLEVEGGGGSDIWSDSAFALSDARRD